MIFFYFKFL